MIAYPLDRLYDEMAYIARQFHWPYGELMSLDHVERQRWVKEIATINSQLAQSTSA
jgi:hypothetical protein